MAYPIESTATIDATTAGVTTSFSITQDKLSVKNNGTNDVKIAVGGLTDLYVRPGDTQVWNVQFTSFTATGIGDTRSITYIAYENGTDEITRAEVTTDKIKGLVALTDAAATLTAAQIVANSIFVQTPGAARNLTTATAAQLAAAFPGWSAGVCFEITVVNKAESTHAATLVGGTGVTIEGSAVVAAASSGTFIVRIASATAAVVYRK